MQDRTTGEQVAKAGIYLIFSLSLFAFLMFVHGARQFEAAGAPVDSAPAVVGQSAAAPSSVAQEPPAPTAAPQEEAILEKGEGAAKDLKNPSDAKLEEIPQQNDSILPNTYGKELDAAALQGELARMSAMGFSLSSDLEVNYVGEFYATSYCAEAYPHICGGNGVTASGTVPTPGLTVASDWSVLPPGTWIYIGGVGIRRVEDSGSAIKGARLDVVLATHASALSWSGQGNHDVWILA